MAIREITSKTPGAFCFLVYTIRENNVGNQSLFGAMKTVFDYPTRFAFINCSFDYNCPVYIFAGFITENGGTVSCLNFFSELSLIIRDCNCKLNSL